MDKIDETPLGGKNFSDIMAKNTKRTPAKGLSKLLGEAKKDYDDYIEKNTPNAKLDEELSNANNDIPEQQIIHNEFLRTEREKNKELQETIENIYSKLKDIKNHNQDIQFLNHEKELSYKELVKNKIFVSTAISLLVSGILLGLLAAPSKTVVETKTVFKESPVTPTKVIPTVTKEVVPSYVTLKFTNLRNDSHPTGKLLKTLSPNQKLELVEQKGGWLKVKYNDLIEEKTISGWVWYELVRKLKKK